MEKMNIMQLHQTGQLSEAQVHYEDYLSRNPDDTDVLHLLAIVYLQKKQVQSALSCAKKLHKLAPANSNYLVVYANCQSLLNQDKHATKLFNRAIDLCDNPAHIYNMMGNHYYRKGCFEDAKKSYQCAQELNPTLHEARFNYILTLINTKDYDEALVTLETLVSQVNSLEYQIQLSQLYHQLGHTDKAREQYQAILSQDPTHYMTHHRLASLYLEDQDLKQAKHHYKQVIQLMPSHTETLHNLASIYLNQKQYQEALVFWHKQAEIEPDATTYYNLGICYYYLNRFDDAGIYLTQCLECDPNYTNAYLNLANLSLRSGQAKEAIGYYKLVLSKDPTCEEARYLLAALSDETEQYAKSPAIYVSRLFDQYAEYYNKHLKDMLDYQVPQHLYEIVETSGYLNQDRPFLRGLDLGVGTGLVGQLFNQYVTHKTGVDLSESMIKEAKSLGIYQDLVCADLFDYLADDNDFDIILLADVLPYIGDLSQLAELLVSRLTDRALLAFSIELLDDDTQDYALQHTARFAHNPKYIAGLFAKCLVKVSDNVRVLRRQNQQDIRGVIYLYKKIDSFS
ncbi:MAG: hypothetical protein CMF46_01605 [Legionellales bacterium]|nr:hypothetical protein [Legionellales bacterium]